MSIGHPSPRTVSSTSKRRRQRETNSSNMPQQDEACESLTNKEKASRVRQFHTRSRTGCSNCRNRRKRCDEQRPQCSSCVKGDRVCVYAPVKIPLRERRAQQKDVQPWDQTPWEVGATSRELVSASRVTTIPLRLSFLNRDTGFNKMGINMPLRSHELFQYFFESENNFKMPGPDCLTTLVDDPGALRSAILLAGMHFSFQYGDLALFEPTFLFHKVEVMRMINQWIASRDSKLKAEIIRQMATLAFTEICQGEFLPAETHVSGILALIDTGHDESAPGPNGRSTDQELANRSYSYLCGLKSLLGGVVRIEGWGSSLDALPGTKIVEMSHLWHQKEGTESLALKLQAIRLFPYFFSPLPHGAKLGHADVHGIIETLREFTVGLDDVYLNQRDEFSEKTFHGFWRRGPASKILGDYVMAHARSISMGEENTEDSKTKPTSFTGPWCGLVIASILYMQLVLGALEPVQRRIHKYTVTLFQHDVAITLSDETKLRNDEFILWQLLVGLARLMGVFEWPEAKAILSKVVWPVVEQKSGFINVGYNGAREG
ncbi:sterol regulatory element-binding ECM22 [Fusarium heterosporum]|uniref:Sterol regulatory element-binding ECM22 n=1 Tax=Fusarium heterosporum TaxID=42747 RepID=A0A8H5TWX5_FUSHE|nr:sterol regulatory element-binding ECM22 [Fusarium heterosporum]